MNGCKYEHVDRKCYHPDDFDEKYGADWCVEGPCHLKVPDDEYTLNDQLEEAHTEIQCLTAEIERLSVKDEMPTLKDGCTNLIYICSPCRGNVAENLNLAQMYCIYAFSKGYTPIAPHLMFRGLLSDDNPKERERALTIGLQLLSFCSEMWVFGDTITEGMRGEIDYATKHNIKIVYKRTLA